MIRFRYTSTLEDYLSFQRHAIRRTMPRSLLVIMGALVVAFLLSPITDYGQPVKKGILQCYVSGLGLLILPGAMAFIYVSILKGAKRRWSEASDLREEAMYEIDESGVRVTGASFNSFIEWQHVAEADVNGNFYFLRTTQKQYHYFKKSAVQACAPLDDLIARKVSAVRGIKTNA